MINFKSFVILLLVWTPFGCNQLDKGARNGQEDLLSGSWEGKNPTLNDKYTCKTYLKIKKLDETSYDVDYSVRVFATDSTPIKNLNPPMKAPVAIQPNQLSAEDAETLKSIHDKLSGLYTYAIDNRILIKQLENGNFTQYKLTDDSELYNFESREFFHRISLDVTKYRAPGSK